MTITTTYSKPLFPPAAMRVIPSNSDQQQFSPNNIHTLS